MIAVLSRGAKASPSLPEAAKEGQHSAARRGAANAAAPGDGRAPAASVACYAARSPAVASPCFVASAKSTSRSETPFVSRSESTVTAVMAHAITM
jgi:hypothetical protein